MKIDLHCHTKKVKRGESDTRNVTTELFSMKIKEANVEIVAITNHNTFDIEQFQCLQEAVLDYCILWPGVELDISDNNRTSHLIVICNPINIGDFHKAVIELVSGESPESFRTSILRVVQVFEPLDSIFIPHYHKEPELSEEDITRLSESLNEKYRLFRESTYRSIGVLSSFRTHVIAGSDVQNWATYETISLPELRLPVETFSQFCLLAKKDTNIVQTLLNKKTSMSSPCSPYEGVIIQIPIYSDINIFFGSKGTGKTKILESLLSHFSTHGYNCKFYSGSKHEEMFSEFEKIDFSKVSCQLFDIDDCERAFSRTFSWIEVTPTSIQEYIDHCDTRLKKKSRMEIKISNATTLPLPKSKLDVPSDFNVIQEIEKKITPIFLRKYIDEEQATTLLQLISYLKDIVKQSLADDFIECTAIYMSNHFIDKIKFHLDRHTGTKSRPTGTGFEKYAENRFELFQNIDPIYASLTEVPVDTQSEFLGVIEGKGQLHLITQSRFFCTESTAQEYNRTYSNLKAVRKLIVKTHKAIFDDVAPQVYELRQACFDYSITNLTPFIGVRRYYTLNETMEYTPSNGEKGMILLERVLDPQADVIILDEPESGMSSSFLNEVIIPRINHLACLNKIIIIATHNANVAVRTLPYMSVLREHYNGVFTTYIGNPFSDRLEDIDKRSTVKSWTTESMHILEGGRDAFYERKQIYES